jgi:hypothetical protein
MSEMKFTAAEKDLFCTICKGKGFTEPTILSGHTYYQNDTDENDTCCVDCFEAMMDAAEEEAIEASQEPKKQIGISLNATVRFEVPASLAPKLTKADLVEMATQALTGRKPGQVAKVRLNGVEQPECAMLVWIETAKDSASVFEVPEK